MTNVMATKRKNDQRTGGKVTNEMTNVMAGTAREWRLTNAMEGKWQTKWRENDKQNGGKMTNKMARKRRTQWRKNDKRKAGKWECNGGKMTNVMWGKSNERSAGKWQTKWQESNKCNNGKMTNVMALKWTQSAGKPRKSLGYECDLFHLFRIATTS